METIIQKILINLVKIITAIIIISKVFNKMINLIKKV